jgi:hypothetical protein
MNCLGRRKSITHVEEIAAAMLEFLAKNVTRTSEPHPTNHGTIRPTSGQEYELRQPDHDLRHCRHYRCRIRDVSGFSPELKPHRPPVQTTKKANSNEPAFSSYRLSLPGEGTTKAEIY